MPPVNFWRRVYHNLDRIVSEGSHLEEMIEKLTPVLDTDHKLAEIDPFDRDHCFVDTNSWESLPLTDLERGRMKDESDLIKKSLRTIYEVLFQRKYGRLTDGNFEHASLLTFADNSESAFCVRVWDNTREAWVIDFEAGYYWTDAGDRRTLEFHVHNIGSSPETFDTFRAMIHRLCILVGNRSLAESILSQDA
jgi:hypothetical protein